MLFGQHWCSLGIAAMFVHTKHQLEKQFVQVNSISFNVML
jgi:hypothetical protein